MLKRSTGASFFRFVMLGALLGPWGCATRAGAQSSDPADGGWEAPVDRPLLIVGSVLFFGAYVPSLAYAKSSSYNGDTYIKYPLVGPWLDLSSRRCSTDPCDARHLSGGLLIADGVAQGLGLVGVVAGLLISETTMRHWLTPRRVWVSPGRVAQAAYGVGALGSF